MDTTDNPQPDPTADKRELSIEEQLDQLLVAIEKQEPGTIEPDKLPKAYRDEMEANEPEAVEPSAATPPTADDADVMQEIAAALESTAVPNAEPSAEPTAQAPDADAMIEAATLEQAAAEQTTTDEPAEVADAFAAFEEALQSDTSTEEAAAPIEPAAAPATATDAAPPAADATPTTEETPAEPDNKEADMLEALNAALLDLNPNQDAPPKAPKEHPPAPSQAEQARAEQDNTPQPAADDADTGGGDSLADQINALLNAPAAPQPQAEAEAEAPAEPAEDIAETVAKAAAEPAAAPPTVDKTAAESATQEESRTQEQIAEEIENLLKGSAEPEGSDAAPTIDDLDQMLAEEIDLDDELAGDFQSVDDITAGIQADIDAKAEPQAVLEPVATGLDDNSATAADVAAELDSQPENQPAPPPPPPAPAPEPDFSQDAEDPFATLAAIAETAEKNEVAYQEEVAASKSKTKIALPKWLAWITILIALIQKIDRAKIEAGKQQALRACFALNWPARRFLSNEWRANLGYIALLNLAGAGIVWGIVLFF